MAELEQQGQQEGFKEIKKLEHPSQTLEQSCNTLAKFGGFDLLEAVIEGASNLNPERKAKKKIFLTESGKKADRETVKKTMKLWMEILNESDSVGDIIEKAQQKTESADKCLKSNLKKALETTADLERSYRSVALFFKNAESDKIKNVSFMNAELDQLKDLDNPIFFNKVREELTAKYDRLDLRENYSIMVLPGYLGSNSVVEKWAKMAYENKVMLVTDFAHLDTPDDVMELFEEANLAGGDIYRSAVMMTCNWLVGRGKVAEVGEEEDLYVPPSGALGGTVYKTLMSQVAAGKKHGGMSEVDGVKFDLKKSEIANLEKMGLIPMVNEYGKVMSFSAKTLFNGDNLGLQTYSVVRVFDYITKVLMDFLNRRAFENFNSKMQQDLRGQIIKFLDNVTGPGKLIENFKIQRFEQDPNQKDRIYLDIHMTPYFPAKSFMIKMDGQKGDDGTAWESEYAKG
ncbi:MAG TPA: DUF5458 family protein [Bacteroidia bacterium]|nr:DUF5458 family protein [Bacteroidia bacterium]